MIKTVSDFLTKFQDMGIKKIGAKLDIGHNPTIGSMYEGLTQDMLEYAVFKNIDIRVVSGKIINSQGQYSSQIDCMIVVGEGEEIPFTNLFIYPINQVIMVVEVKKNLHKKELIVAINNLRSVSKIAYSEKKTLNYSEIKDAYISITGNLFPDSKEFNELSVTYKSICKVLLYEAQFPVRVVWGYEGFRNEQSLREKFIEALESILQEENREMELSGSGGEMTCFGLNDFPNLIISDNDTIVKTNGMPYGYEFNPDDGLVWMASYRRNPFIILLELLWTRLSYQYNLPVGVFGKVVHNEALAPLLFANINENKRCFEYAYSRLSSKDINFIDENYEKEWSPFFVTKDEYALLLRLGECDELSLEELKMQFELNNLEVVLKRLTSFRLITIDKNSNVKLLTKKCILYIDPELGYIAADDYDGRFTNWMGNRMKNIND